MSMTIKEMNAKAVAELTDVITESIRHKLTS